MRIHLVGSLLLGAALLEVGLLACSKKSYEDNPTDGDASDGSAAVETSLGDDVSSADDLIGYEDVQFFEGGGTECTIPTGAYSVVRKFPADASDGDGGTCAPTTSTFVWPPGSAPDGGGPSDIGVDGGCGGDCCYSMSGDLPICAIYFNCSADDGQYTTKTTGFIQVFNGTYAGEETQEFFADADAGMPLFTCAYDLSYTLQQ